MQSFQIQNGCVLAGFIRDFSVQISHFIPLIGLVGSGTLGL